MRGVSKLLLVFALAVLLASGLAACGGDDSDDSTSGSSTAPAQEKTATTPEKTAPKPAKDRASGNDSSADEGSASFLTAGGDNSIQNFGEEADAAEAAAATATLAAYLRARAKDDFAKECAYLAKAAVAPLEEFASRSPQPKDKGCAAILSTLSAGTPSSIRANTLRGDIASLRFDGDRGFALYHGAKGVDYFVPMVKEDGEWKVGTLAPSEFP
jgi:hypothetical protein